MMGMLVLLAIEAVLATAALTAARGRQVTAALYLLALTAPLEIYRTSVGGVNVSLFRLSLALAALALALHWRSCVRSSLSQIDWTLPAAYCALAVAIGVALALNPVNTFLGGRLLATVVIGVVSVVVVALLVRQTSLEELARALIFACVLPIVAASWQALGPRVGAEATLPLVSELAVAEGLEVSTAPPAVVDGLSARTKGTFGDPNHYGTFLMVSLVTGLALTGTAVRDKDRLRAATGGAACFAIALSLISTYSRTAWLATVGAVLLLSVLVRPRLRPLVQSRRSQVALVLTCLAGIGVAVPVLPNLRERIDPSATVNQGTNEAHEGTARAALDAFAESPVWGTGPGALGAELAQGKRTSGAHSTYLTAAAELGTLGLVAVLVAAWLVLSNLMKFRRGRGRVTTRAIGAAFAAAYAGFLLANLTYDLWYDDFHWLLAGAASSAIGAFQPHGSTASRYVTAA